MNSFRKNQELERLSREQLMPFLLDVSENGQLAFTDKGRLAKELQSAYGDAILNLKGSEKVCAVEMKAEWKNDYKNFFLEYWSNRQWYTLGWMHKLNTDVLLYHFYEDGLLYSLPFQRLKSWAFGPPSPDSTSPGRMYRFPLRKQKQHAQLNDTWGFCCKIDDVLREVKGNCYTRDSDGNWTRNTDHDSRQGRLEAECA